MKQFLVIFNKKMIFGKKRWPYMGKPLGVFPINAKHNVKSIHTHKKAILHYDIYIIFTLGLRWLCVGDY